MKKKIFILILILTLLLPVTAKAKTISEFEAEVNRFTADLQEKQRKLVTNEKEIAVIKKKIANIEYEIRLAEEEKVRLQKEIEESNKKIKEKTEESKAIIEYYQIASGDSAYLEYAFGAKTITDMIYRLSVVEQLTEYNNKVMEELEKLVKENEKKKEELTIKEANLEKMSKRLSEEKSKIQIESNVIRETMPSVEQQIKAAKANLDYYKKLGCGKTEEIAACQFRIEQQNGSSGGSVPSTNGFFRPMLYGYVTQWYKGKAHMGVDLSSSDKAIDIYPIATGRVFRIMYDPAGALVVKVKHNYNNKYIYSTYAHLRSFGNISEGQIVTPFTSLGKMGSTGNSTGPHLHMEITTCDWNRGGGCTWSEYQNRTVNPTNYVELPSRWTNR